MSEQDDNKDKKEVGGMGLPDGFAIGPMYFSKDGKTASSMVMQPAVVAFDSSLANTINRLNKLGELDGEELQTEFNSLVDSLISDTLIYLQNRLKPIVQGGSGHFNKIGDAVKEYAKAGIEIANLCDLAFLQDLSDVRGRKHHTDRRYDSDYTIDGISYNNLEILLSLATKVRDEINSLDANLKSTHPDYDVKVTRTANSMSVEIKAINHAHDMTRGGRVVPKKK